MQLSHAVWALVVAEIALKKTLVADPMDPTDEAVRPLREFIVRAALIPRSRICYALCGARRSSLDEGAPGAEARFVGAHGSEIEERSIVY